MKIYIADSFPVPVCRNIRIKRCKIYDEECFRGYIASQLNYFYGIKVQSLMSGSGIPAKIVLSHGSCSGISAFYGFSLQLPKGSVILADKAYNYYCLTRQPYGSISSSHAGQKEKLKKENTAASLKTA